jgi:hypothetical protein
MIFEFANTEAAKKIGLEYDGAMGFIPSGYFEREKLSREILLAFDAAREEIPPELLFVCDEVPFIMTGKEGARLLFRDRKIPDMRAPAGDAGEAGKADRPGGVEFERVVKYDNLDLDISSVAKLELASARQKEAATGLNKLTLDSYLHGDPENKVNGLVGNPGLPEAISPVKSGKDSAAAWHGKSPVRALNDITLLHKQLLNNSKGLVTDKTPLTLAIFPKSHSGTAEFLERHAFFLENIKALIPDIDLEIFEGSKKLPESKMLLFAPEIRGEPTAEFLYFHKFRLLPLKKTEEGFEQKIVAASGGCVVKTPEAFAVMSGI